MYNRHRTTRERRRDVAGRARAVLLACLLIAGLLRSGARYFVCPMMGAVLDVACCGEHRVDHPRVTSLRPADCCKAKQLGTVPAASLSSAPEIAAAPYVALPPMLRAFFVADPARSATRRGQPARAGPPTANERRAELMVWNS